MFLRSHTGRTAVALILCAQTLLIPGIKCDAADAGMSLCSRTVPAGIALLPLWLHTGQAALTNRIGVHAQDTHQLLSYPALTHTMHRVCSDTLLFLPVQIPRVMVERMIQQLCLVSLTSHTRRTSMKVRFCNHIEDELQQLI